MPASSPLMLLPQMLRVEGLCWGYIGIMEQANGNYYSRDLGCRFQGIGIMDKKTETTIVGVGCRV